MHTTQTLLGDLTAMGITAQDTLLVHSSIKSVGPVEGGADTILSALEQSVSEGLLVLPTHTWADIKADNPIFDIQHSPSCVGKLPEVFRARPGVLRSKHPTHSVAAKGADAQAFVAGHEQSRTPCAWDSPWGRLCQRQGKVLLMGVDFSRNTLIHCVEEIMGIPGRIRPDAEQLFVRDWDGSLIPVPSMRHFGADSDTYRKLESPLLHMGIARRVTFGDAPCLLVSIAPMFRITMAFLTEDPNLFSNFDPIPTHWYR